MSEYNTQTEKIEKEINSAHEVTINQYKTKGQHDGRINTPKDDFDGISPTESAIKSKYQGLIADLSAKGGQDLQTQINEINHIKSDLSNLSENPTIIQNKLVQLEAQKKLDIETENNNNKNNIITLYQTPSYLDAIGELQKVEELYQKKSKEVGRAAPHTSGKWYWIILILIGISEFSLNYVAFSKTGSNILETAIMALSAGLIFPLLAHYVSKLIRQREEIHQKALWFAIGVTILALILAWLLAYLRGQVTITNNPNMAQSEADASFLMFFFLVTLIFLGGGFLVYFSLDPSPEFTNLYQMRLEKKKVHDQEVKKIYEKNILETKRHTEKLSQIESIFLDKRNEINQELSNLKTKFKNAISAYESSVEYFKSIEQRISANYKTTIHVYRENNLQNRTDGTMPNSWKVEPQELELYFQKYKNQSFAL